MGTTVIQVLTIDNDEFPFVGTWETEGAGYANNTYTPANGIGSTSPSPALVQGHILQIAGSSKNPHQGPPFPSDPTNLLIIGFPPATAAPAISVNVSRPGGLTTTFNFADAIYNPQGAVDYEGVIWIWPITTYTDYFSNGVTTTLTFTYPSPPVLSGTAGFEVANLSWTNLGADTYNVYQSSTPGGELPPPTRTGITGLTSAIGLSDATTAYFTVTAVTGGTESAFSNEVTVTTPAPPILSATALVQSIQLDWTAMTGAASYNIYQSDTSGGETPPPTLTGITALTTTITGLTPGTTYYFTVTGVDSEDDESNFSNEVSGIPLAPTSTQPSSMSPVNDLIQYINESMTPLNEAEYRG